LILQPIAAKVDYRYHPRHGPAPGHTVRERREGCFG